MNLPAATSSDGQASAASIRPVVVLVEDDDMLRSLTRMMLHDAGFDVVDCATALYALDVITTRSDVSLLMTDVKLPGMSGPELVGAVRAIDNVLPTVYVTGWDRARLTSWGVPADALLLTKPFFEDDVTAIVRRALGAVAAD